MYDVFVIANYDTPELRKKFRSLFQYTTVHFVFDRHATHLEQYPSAIERSGLQSGTECYYVIRGEQTILGDPKAWLAYDMVIPSVVCWPVSVDGVNQPGMGICLFPEDAHKIDYPLVHEEIALTGSEPFPIIVKTNDGSKLEYIKELARRTQATHFHYVPHGVEFDPPAFPLFNPDNMGWIKNPIVHSPVELPREMTKNDCWPMQSSGILTIPSAICTSDAPIEYLIWGGGWPVAQYSGPFKKVIDKSPMYDVVMLSNGELNADRHWDLLKARFPHATRVDGVKGILEAHVAAANQGETEYFWVVDADNQVHPEAALEEIRIPFFDPPRFAVWHARNSVNGLSYGYGGIKLFHRRTVQEMKHALMEQDFAGMVAKRVGGMIVVPDCWSTTVIDSTPFEAWRAGYREASKLQLWLDEHTLSDPMWKTQRDRWFTWVSESNTPNGKFTLRGAYCGVLMVTVNEPGGAKSAINSDSHIRSEYEKDCKRYEDSPEWETNRIRWVEEIISVD